MIFFARRIIFVLSVIQISDFLWFQLATQTIVSVTLVAFIWTYDCFNSAQLKWIETVNEITIILLTYILFCFTDFVADPQTRNDLGLVYIFISLLNITGHILIMLCQSLYSIKKAVQRRIKKQKAGVIKANKVTP